MKNVAKVRGSRGPKGVAGPVEPSGLFWVIGQSGATGDTAGCMLPARATETGTWTWTLGVTPGSQTEVATPLLLPLEEALDGGGCSVVETGEPIVGVVPCKARFVNAVGKEVFFNLKEEAPEPVTATTCVGSVVESTASSDYFCLYTESLTGAPLVFSGNIDKPGVRLGTTARVSTTGAYLRFGVTPGAIGWGTWAVAAE